MTKHFYYLHTNGDLIAKKFRPESDSPFVRKVWEIDTRNRLHAWDLIIEAASVGARQDRVEELASKWGLTDEDAQQFVAHTTDSAGNPSFKLYRDGNQWCATRVDFENLQESPAGFGDTCLEALIDLRKND